MKHVIIGVGAGVFSAHRPALQLKTVDVISVSDINPELGRARAAELGCTFYADYKTMLAETRPDVAVIMTPHPFHAPIAIDCLNAGCHVLVEKPIAVQVADADAMIAAAERAGRLLAVNFQQRHRPEIRKARELITAGRLGVLQRVELVAVWTRPAAYYELGAWRGTWAGEGGGVLMNQGPHNLDLLCHLAGLPSRVVAWTRTRLHRIETEDTALAMLEWPNGAVGSVFASTAEAGQPERLELVGTRGVLQISRAQLTFEELETDLRDFVAASKEPFAAPPHHTIDLELESSVGDHVAVYRDLHAAILQCRRPMADGVEGRMSLELANAMIYSGATGREVDLPLDRRAYAALLEELKTGRLTGARAGVR